MNLKEKNNLDVQVVVKKVINASRERVFDAWTKPELMAKWYCGGPGRSESAVDLRVGGEYTNNMFIVGESTCLTDREPGENEECYKHSGEYLEIKRPEKLVFTWTSPSVQNTIVTVELKEVNQGTEITITHLLASAEQSEGHQKGWTFALETLATFIS